LPCAGCYGPDAAGCCDWAEVGTFREQQSRARYGVSVVHGWEERSHAAGHQW